MDKQQKTGEEKMINADIHENINVNQAEVQIQEYRRINVNGLNSPESILAYVKEEKIWEETLSNELLDFLLKRIDTFVQESSFESIEALLMYLATVEPRYSEGYFIDCTFPAGIGHPEKLIAFLEKLIGYAQQENRYWEIIETILTYQPVKNHSIPVASWFVGKRMSEFTSKVLNKLPEAMQKRLKEATFYREDDGRMKCRELLTYKLVSID